MTSNDSGIHPIEDRVLIKTLELERTTASGIILSTITNSEREEMANTTGEIVEAGPDVPEWCKAGDRIIFAKYAGLLYVGKDQKKYRVIGYENIVATLDGDVKLVDPFLKKGLD